MLYVKQFEIIESIDTCTLKETVTIKGNFNFVNSYKLKLFETELLKFWKKELNKTELLIRENKIEFFDESNYL